MIEAIKAILHVRLDQVKRVVFDLYLMGPSSYMYFVYISGYRI